MLGYHRQLNLKKNVKRVFDYSLTPIEMSLEIRSRLPLLYVNSSDDHRRNTIGKYY